MNALKSKNYNFAYQGGQIMPVQYQNYQSYPGQFDQMLLQQQQMFQQPIEYLQIAQQPLVQKPAAAELETPVITAPKSVLPEKQKVILKTPMVDVKKQKLQQIKSQRPTQGKIDLDTDFSKKQGKHLKIHDKKYNSTSEKEDKLESEKSMVELQDDFDSQNKDIAGRIKQLESQIKNEETQNSQLKTERSDIEEDQKKNLIQSETSTESQNDKISSQIVISKNRAKIANLKADQALLETKLIQAKLGKDFVHVPPTSHSQISTGDNQEIDQVVNQNNSSSDFSGQNENAKVDKIGIDEVINKSKQSMQILEGMRNQIKDESNQVQNIHQQDQNLSNNQKTRNQGEEGWDQISQYFTGRNGYHRAKKLINFISILSEQDNDFR